MKTLPLVVGLAVALAGCASGPSVRSMSDPQANFASYQTFGFADPLGTDRSGYRSVVSEALKTSTRRQLEARGFTYVAENPQLLVNFNAQLNDKMRVNTTPTSTMGMGYYGYRGRLYAPYPLYAEQTTVSEYKEGTLNIDVADSAAKRLLWEGVVSQAVTQKALDNVPAALDTAVAAAFEKFPVAARP
ncbi:MAG: DUF4136 domain-containing protein [Polymorphobacter sp.]|uniref:DUF4136 domain-containing protein n=1 Tax=Polymorphobacter sp. TaxID=1909290 RepID=UPI003A851D73